MSEACYVSSRCKQLVWLGLENPLLVKMNEEKQYRRALSLRSASPRFGDSGVESQRFAGFSSLLVPVSLARLSRLLTQTPVSLQHGCFFAA